MKPIPTKPAFRGWCRVAPKIVLALFRELRFKNAWYRTLYAVKLTWRYLRKRDKAETWLVVERLGICEKCAFYDSTTQTCGTLGVVFNEEGEPPEPLGCWCWLPLAAHLKSKECWATENGIEDGWKR